MEWNETQHRPDQFHCARTMSRFAGSTRPTVATASRQELESLISDKLSDVLDDRRRANKFRNLLYAMANRDKSIMKTGGRQKGRWVLASLASEKFQTIARQT